MAQALIGNPQIIILTSPPWAWTPRQIIETTISSGSWARSIPSFSPAIFSPRSDRSAIIHHHRQGELVAYDTPENLDAPSPPNPPSASPWTPAGRRWPRFLKPSAVLAP